MSFLTQKQMLKDEKLPIKCQDGPFAGYTLWLTDYTTAVFKVKDQCGRYIHGNWHAVYQH